MLYRLTPSFGFRQWRHRPTPQTVPYELASSTHVTKHAVGLQTVTKTYYSVCFAVHLTFDVTHPLSKIMPVLRMSACFCVFFSPVNAVVKQSSRLVFHTTQSIYQEISVTRFSQVGLHNDDTSGVEPATVQSLAQCWIQLS